jgi:LPS O-antigen subunit length determinant protein (WzzB/FepE family)
MQQHINFNIFFLVETFKKYLKQIIVFNALVAVVAIVTAFILPVAYESKVIFYPYSPEASDPRNMLNFAESFDVFSKEDHSQKFIYIGKSKNLKREIADKYHLIKRYEISADSMEMESKLMDKMDDNIVFKKGERGAVLLSVFDRNRDTAAIIANDLVYMVEKESQREIREKNYKVFEVYEAQYRYVEKVLNEIEQKEALIKQKTDHNLNKQSAAIENYNAIKLRYEQAKSLLNTDLKTISVVEYATPTYKKARPKRLIIVGISVLLGFVFSLTSLALKDYFKF